MKSIEINFVVSDCKKAVLLYEKIFDIKLINLTNLEKGLNEAVFSLHGLDIHILDENPEYMLLAPKENEGVPMWINVTVENIVETFDNAIVNGCTIIKAISEVKPNLYNAMFKDEFGYIWLLHEVIN